MRGSRTALILGVFLAVLSAAVLSTFMQIDIDSAFSDWGGAENVSDASADQPQTRALSLWNVTYSNASEDIAYAIAVDTSGRVFVAGAETGAGGGQGNTDDWRIMALNATDGSSLWNVTYSNASEDIAKAVTADTSGRVFVAGGETGVGGGHGGTEDWRIMALNAADGTSLWNVTYSNASFDIAKAVTADTSGRVFVAGYEIGVGGGQGQTYDWRIMALNAADGSSLWNVTYSNASSDIAFAVAADTSGRVFVAGYETGAGGGQGNTDDDWRIMALNATDGSSLWNVTYSNASEDTEDIAFAIAVDTSGRVFVAGGEIQGGTIDWRIMALNAADGASLWNMTYSNASSEEALGVAADTSGRVFVAGYEIGVGGGHGETYDWRIMALDAADGASLWNVTYSNASGDSAYAIAADTSGRVFVAGGEVGVEGGIGGTNDWRIMALQHVDGVSASFDLSDIGLAHNATHLNAYIRVSNNIDFSDGGRYYRFFVSTDFSEGNDTTPEGETLPFNYSFRVQVNGSVCTLFNYTHPNSGTPDCSFANASQEMEIQVLLDTLNLSLGDSINVSFETGNASQRFDLAPDLPGFVSYTLADCITPRDDLIITADTTLCSGTWAIDDAADDGVLRIEADNLVLQCAGAVLYGDDSQSDAGIGINVTGRNNVTITNCTVRNYSYNVYFDGTQNSTLSFSELTTTTNTTDDYPMEPDDYPVFLTNADSNTLVNLTLSTSGIPIAAVYLTNSSYNVLSNLSVSAAGSTGSAGVYFTDYSQGNTLSDSVIQAPDRPVYIGDVSFGNTLLNLSLSVVGPPANSDGAVVLTYGGTVMRNVSIDTSEGGAAIYITVTGAIGAIHHDIDTSNLADGKPIYYTNDTSLNNGVLLSDTSAYGQVIIAGISNVTLTNITMTEDGITILGSDNVTMQGLTLLTSSVGLYLENTGDSRVIGARIETTGQSKGVLVRELGFGSGNTFSNISINITDNSAVGLDISGEYGSSFDNITVTGALIGVSISSADLNEFSDLTLLTLETGVFLQSDSSGNRFVSLDITTNSSVKPGIEAYTSGFDYGNNAFEDVAINATNSPEIIVTGIPNITFTGVLLMGSVNFTAHLLSGVSIDVNATPPADPAGKSNLSDYLTIINISAGASIDFNLSYADADIAGDAVESSIRIYRYNESAAAWELVGTSSVDTASNTVRSGNITSGWGLFALLAENPAPAPGSQWSSTPATFNASALLDLRIVWTDNTAVDAVIFQVNRSGFIENHTAAQEYASRYYLNASEFLEHDEGLDDTGLSVLTDAEIATLLNGSLTNSKGSANYTQRLELPASARVTYTIDPDDITDTPAWYLKFDSAQRVYTYILNFTQPLRSDNVTHPYILSEFVGLNLTLFDMWYRIENATRYSNESLSLRLRDNASSDLIVFNDTDITSDESGGMPVWIGTNTVSDVQCQLGGASNSTELNLTHIICTWTADEDIYVPVQANLSNDEDDDQMFLGFDIEFVSVESDSDITTIALSPNGDDEYVLNFTNTENTSLSVPLYDVDEVDLRYGSENGNLIVAEYNATHWGADGIAINPTDYFVVSDENSEGTFLLKYMGQDDASDLVWFTIWGYNQEILETDFSYEFIDNETPSANISIGGINFSVYLTADAFNQPIMVDLDGDGTLISGKIPRWYTRYGVRIGVHTTPALGFNITTEAEGDSIASGGEVITVIVTNSTANTTEIGAVGGSVSLQTVGASGNQEGYDVWGTHVVKNYSATGPDTLTFTYPDNQTRILIAYLPGAPTSTYNLTLTDFPAGTHAWRSHANDTSGNANTTDWQPFTINTTSPALSLTLGGTAGDKSVVAGSTVTLNGSVVTGDSNATLLLYRGGTLLANGTGVSYTSAYSAAGSDIISLNYTETQNYSSAVVSHTLTVTANTSGTTQSSGSGGAATLTASTAPSATKVFTSASQEGGLQMSIASTEIPVSRIEVELTAGVSNAEITVKAMDEKPAAAADAPQTSAGTARVVYSYLEISHRNLAGRIGSATIGFKVARSWLAANSISKGDILLQRWTGSNWEDLPTAVAEETDNNIYYQATTTGFSVFAITVKAAAPLAEPREQPEEEAPEEIPAADGPAEGPPDAPPEEESEQASFPWGWVALALVLMVASGGFIATRLARRTPTTASQQRPAGVSPQPGHGEVSSRLTNRAKIATYIRDCRGQGYQDEAIRAQLLRAGYDTGQVDECLRDNP